MPVSPPSATTTQQGENVLVRASAGITLRILLPPPFFRHPTTDRFFYVFLPPIRPRDVIYDVHGQPRSTSETPRRRPSSVVYMVVYVRVLQRGVAL